MPHLFHSSNNACTRTAVLAPLKWLNLSEDIYPLNRLVLTAASDAGR